MTEAQETFHPVGLEDEENPSEVLPETEEMTAPATIDSSATATPPLQPAEISDVDLRREDSGPDLVPSVERSMERTVNIPARDAGLVSVSPVDDRDLVVTILDASVTMPANSYSSPYATYGVVTTTSRQTFDKREYSVRRRYQDFLWLREQLANTYKTHIVPPLPEKHSIQRIMQNDHFDAEFLLRRKAALQKFLARCTDHPTMSFDRTFMAFLTASDEEFDAAKFRGVGLMDKMSANFRSAATGFLLKNPDPEFTALQSYFRSLSKHLVHIEGAALGALQDGNEEVTELKTMADLCQKWSEIENDDSKMQRILSEAFQSHCDISSSLYKDLSPAYAPFHEYSLFCGSAQEMLKRREALQMDHELAMEDMKSKETALGGAKVADMSKSVMALFSNPEKLKQQRVEHAEKAFAAAQVTTERAHDDLECANEHLRADMTRWQQVKKSDMANSFVELADIHISHLQQSLDVWQNALASLEGEGTSSGETLLPPSASGT